MYGVSTPYMSNHVRTTLNAGCSIAGQVMVHGPTTEKGPDTIRHIHLCIDRGNGPSQEGGPVCFTGVETNFN